MIVRRPSNQTTDIKGFDNFAELCLYTDRGVAMDHLPMDRMDSAVRFAQRRDQLVP